MTTTPRTRAGLVLLTLIVACQPVLADEKKKAAGQPATTIPEKLKKIEGGNPWAIGPTGIIAYIGNKGRAELIRIKAIDKNSPADGRLQAGDVILGLGDSSFGPDPDLRRLLANAVIEAEKEENGGKITFKVWRPAPAEKAGDGDDTATGTIMQVTLTVPVMGTYSETTPWECPKTTAIINKAAEHLVKTGIGGGIPGNLDALGLLATGEKKYLPVVREYAHKIGDPEAKTSGSGWFAPYKLLFLTEYYLATKDDYVLPHITKQAIHIAKGVSGVGTWSHGFSDNNNYGPPAAYGAMNQCSITCGMSLVMAQKCGVKDSYVDEAVKRATEFLLWYVDKGTIPYGDHVPALNHDNNGRNSQAAVLFDLAGNKEAATYFTRMTLASYPVREGGHTGHFFSWQWGALGAARGGPEATRSFIKNTQYFTELERRVDGRSVYQNMLRGVNKYVGWSTTGSRLMQHCLPRKALYLTGKGGSTVAPMTGDELKRIVAAARFNPKELTVPQLIEALGSWSLVVRHDAAEELGKRKENVVDQLIAMLDSPNRFARYGACIGLQYAGRESAAAVKALIDNVQHAENVTMRYFAAQGLMIKKRQVNGLGDAPKMAIPVLLKQAAIKQDHLGKLQRQLALAFLYTGRVSDYTGYCGGGKGLEKQDPDLVIGAMKAWLTNNNGQARTLASSVFDNLSEEQLDKLWGEIYYAARNPAPSGVMFGGGGQSSSLILLAKHRFKEALPMTVDYLLKDGWGSFRRIPAALDALSYYGAAAKPYVPFARYMVESRKSGKPHLVKNEGEAFSKLMKNIDKTFELRSIKPYLEKAQIPYQPLDITDTLKEKAYKFFGWERIGTPPHEDRIWHYMSLDPKPGVTYPDFSDKPDLPSLPYLATGPLEKWNTPEFDVSTWQTGKAPIGKGVWQARGIEREIRSEWRKGKYLLMRTTFELDDLNYERYRLQMLARNGLVVYLNGHMVFKYHWYTSAPTYRGKEIPKEDNVHLKKGTNLLAVYAVQHEDSPNMVDVYLEGLVKKENFDYDRYVKDLK